MPETRENAPSFNRIYVHLPYIGLADPVLEIKYGAGVIRGLRYTEWESLDSEAAHNVRYAFERTSPVFYACEGFFNESHHEIALRDMQHLYLALVLSTGGHIPAPSKSISYMKVGASITRHVGIFDRAAVLHGPRRLLIDTLVVEQAVALVPLIKECGEILGVPEFKQLLRTLTSTATDDFHAIDGIVSCVIALEGLLLKNVFSGITTTFVNRTCNLLAGAEKNPVQLKSYIETLYSLRSDALHGRNWKSSLSQTSLTDVQWCDYARKILCKSAVAVLLLLKSRTDVNAALDELRKKLD